MTPSTFLPRPLTVAAKPHPAFTGDDLEGTVAIPEEQGVTVILEPNTLIADKPDYRIAFIEGPAGYKIDFVQHQTMKRERPDPIETCDAPYPLRYTYPP